MFSQFENQARKKLERLCLLNQVSTRIPFLVNLLHHALKYKSNRNLYLMKCNLLSITFLLLLRISCETLEYVGYNFFQRSKNYFYKFDNNVNDADEERNHVQRISLIEIQDNSRILDVFRATMSDHVFGPINRGFQWRQRTIFEYF